MAAFCEFRGQRSDRVSPDKLQIVASPLPFLKVPCCRRKFVDHAIVATFVHFTEFFRPALSRRRTDRMTSRSV